MNVNDYGVGFLFGTGFNMSADINLKLAFTKPSTATLIVQSPAVALGIVDVQTPLGIFLANQYAIYTFAEGDVDEAGSWTVRLTYNDGTPRQLISNIAQFVVGP